MRLLILDNPFGPPTIPERMVWTSSSIKLFRRCKRKFFWKYLFKLRPRTKSHFLYIGSAFHNLLGEWYKGKRSSMISIMGPFVEELETAYKTVGGYYDSEDLDKFRIAIDSFQGMMLAYEALYNGDRFKWKIQRPSIEAQFKINMGEFDFAGKIDLVADNYLVEHKTTSKISETYIDRLPLDTQIRGYIMGGREALGFKFNQVLYDVIGKCKLRRKSNESVKDFTDRVAHAYASEPTKYFYREHLRFDKQDIEALKYEIMQTHKEFLSITENWNENDWGWEKPDDPRSWVINDQACTDWFRTCEYHKLCTIGLDKGTGFSFEQSDTLHEELDLDES